jgi:hypothetical protein
LKEKDIEEATLCSILREAEKAHLIQRLTSDKKPRFFQAGWLLLTTLLIYNIL